MDSESIYKALLEKVKEAKTKVDPKFHEWMDSYVDKDYPSRSPRRFSGDGAIVFKNAEDCNIEEMLQSYSIWRLSESFQNLLPENKAREIERLFLEYVAEVFKEHYIR